MKLSSILVLTIGLVAFALPVQAGAGKGDPEKKAKKKAAREALAKYDKNGNGVIDGDEVKAIQGDFKADGPLKRFDTNADGKLDTGEVGAIHAGKKAGKTGKRKKTAV